MGDQLSTPTFTLALVAGALAISVSAGVQAGHEAGFKDDMDDIERAFERLKRGRSNL